jgi:hypothetical protein
MTCWQYVEEKRTFSTGPVLAGSLKKVLRKARTMREASNNTLRHIRTLSHSPPTRLHIAIA